MNPEVPRQHTLRPEVVRDVSALLEANLTGQGAEVEQMLKTLPPSWQDWTPEQRIAVQELDRKEARQKRERFGDLLESLSEPEWRDFLKIVAWKDQQAGYLHVSSLMTSRDGDSVINQLTSHYLDGLQPEVKDRVGAATTSLINEIVAGHDVLSADAPFEEDAQRDADALGRLLLIALFTDLRLPGVDLKKISESGRYSQEVKDFAQGNILQAQGPLEEANGLANPLAGATGPALE